MPLLCPRCAEFQLDELKVGDVIVDRCPRCAGVWFDNAEVGAIADRDVRLKRLESIVPPASYTDYGADCPRCADVPLRKLVCESPDGERRTLFRCVSCLGTWVDRGELWRQEDPGLGQALRQYFLSLCDEDV